MNLCEELGILFVAYSPLGNGFLSGKYTKDTKNEALAKLEIDETHF